MVEVHVNYPVSKKTEVRKLNIIKRKEDHLDAEEVLYYFELLGDNPEKNIVKKNNVFYTDLNVFEKYLRFFNEYQELQDRAYFISLYFSEKEIRSMLGLEVTDKSFFDINTFCSQIHKEYDNSFGCNVRPPTLASMQEDLDEKNN